MTEEDLDAAVDIIAAVNALPRLLSALSALQPEQPGVDAMQLLRQFARIADMTDSRESGASVIVNVDLLRRARDLVNTPATPAARA